jgi:hypothetical protein
MDNIKFLIILYLVQMSNFSCETLSKQMKQFLHENRIALHIINIIFLAVLISIMNKTNLKNIFIVSCCLYIIYLLSTKLDLQYNVLIFSIFLTYYFYMRELELKKNRIIEDTDLDILIKKNIIMMDEYKYYILSTGVVLSLIYFVNVYVSRKTVQYGGGFSYARFFLY